MQSPPVSSYKILPHSKVKPPCPLSSFSPLSPPYQFPSTTNLYSIFMDLSILGSSYIGYYIICDLLYLASLICHNIYLKIYLFIYLFTYLLTYLLTYLSNLYTQHGAQTQPWDQESHALPTEPARGPYPIFEVHACCSMSVLHSFYWWIIFHCVYIL